MTSEGPWSGAFHGTPRFTCQAPRLVAALHRLILHQSMVGGPRAPGVSRRGKEEGGAPGCPGWCPGSLRGTSGAPAGQVASEPWRRSADLLVGNAPRHSQRPAQHPLARLNKHAVSVGVARSATSAADAQTFVYFRYLAREGATTPWPGALCCPGRRSIASCWPENHRPATCTRPAALSCLQACWSNLNGGQIVRD